MGIQSSTMMELEAISIGLQLMDILSRHDGTLSTLHIVTDSQAALRALIGGYNTTELVVTIHTLLWQLSEHISDINITWVPGHTNILENEAADRMAQAIANGSIEGVLSSIPHCLKALRTLLRNHYTNRMHSMWTTLSSGQDLRDCGWRFRLNIRWTSIMDRVSVALTSQFLLGHFTSRQYLHRWTLVDDRIADSVRPTLRTVTTSSPAVQDIFSFEPIGYTQRSMIWALTLHGAYKRWWKMDYPFWQASSKGSKKCGTANAVALHGGHA